MEKTGESPSIDFERYPMTGSYWIKRTFAYVLDTAMAFILVLLLFLLVTLIWEINVGAIWWIVLYLVVGVVTVVGKTIMEFITGTSPGKGIFGMRVVSAYEHPTIGELLWRNFFSILPFIMPILDLIMGSGTEDPRQKMLDASTKTLVVEKIMEVEERPVRHFAPPREEPPVKQEKTKLDFPGRARVGHCPRCGAPYRVLPPGDDSFSGLWNYRCTWCNHLIFSE